VYCAQFLAAPPTSWADAKGDHRLEGALPAIGDLYKEFTPSAWYYVVVESGNKLLITGVLGFVQPGKFGQVVAGTFMTFAMLLVYQYALPYSSRAIRLIAFSGQLVMFLFFIIALLIKSGVPVTATSDQLFYGLACTSLTVAVVAVPVMIVIQRLRFNDLSGEEEEEEEEGEKEKAEEASAHGSHSPQRAPSPLLLPEAAAEPLALSFADELDASPNVASKSSPSISPQQPFAALAAPSIPSLDPIRPTLRLRICRQLPDSAVPGAAHATFETSRLPPRVVLRINRRLK